LARIRQAEQRQFERIALLEGQNLEDVGKGQAQGQGRAQQPGGGPSGVVLPTGILLTESEMKRQNEAADAAYLILIQLIKARTPDKTTTADLANAQIHWMFDFFEGQLRSDQTIVLIKRYLTDHTTATNRIALAYRVLTDSIVWARQNQTTGNIDHAWAAKRHEVFEEARQEIAQFIEKQADEKQWQHAAQLLAIDSYPHEADLVGSLSRERAAGLLVQSVQALLKLPSDAPDHPQLASLPDRVFALADQIRNLGQNEQAIYVLRQITLNYPAHGRANQSLLQIAQLYSTGMQNPLRAVETYQEYLCRTDGDPSVPTQIFAIAKQLADQMRYLESLHVYGVFVDSFPTHAQAANALHAIGKTHQANGVWEEAIDTYERIIEEYTGNAAIPQVKLDIAECQINLGEWLAARKQYEEYLEEFPKDPQVAAAQARLEVLKKLDRFQDLLADDQIDRNKDDAQFQIGLTVLSELANPVKAVEEFRKVIANFGDSDVADDAQMEIGRTLLSLGRLDEGREELLKVPANHPNSPFSDDALFLIGQSYEQHAVRLAKVTQDAVRAESHVMEQQDAYYRFNKQIALEKGRSAQVRGQLKAKGDKKQLALNEAVDASRLGNLFSGQLYCEVTQAELETEAETALQIANRQDRINDAYREAVVIYMNAATNYPLGDKTDQSLLRIAQIFETRLKDKPAAMQTYQKVVKLFPGTPVAEDAAWKVTQFHVEEGQFAQAADAYKNFIRNYPASKRVADAQFGLAEVMEQLGRWVDAMDAYEVFRQKFGKHPKVQLATQQIGWIKTYRK
jgi:TolA-binding protein